MSRDCVIAGYGGLARHMLESCLERYEYVTAMARSAAEDARHNKNGVEFLSMDLDEPSSLSALDVEHKEVFFFVPPSRRDDHDWRMRNFLSAIGSQLPAKILYISTTAVYGNSHGELVSEQSPTTPTTVRGQRRLDAEQQLQEYARRHNVPIVILRVGGIYGADRLPLRQLESARPVLLEQDSGYTNRIHVDDLASICLAAMARGEGIYNVSDGQPGTMADYFIALASALDYPVPRRISLQEARQIMSLEMMSYLEESRRLDVSRLMNELGVSLKYPDLQAGIRQIIKYRAVR
ncbi:MAG: NAD-dependent epimerase/dehydratase family protein [Gammaproteobacteria bacterium]|nr:NAD-dependent epimerase/dehydratase family protein [Gammaproteobacteria bacterium]